MSAFQVSSAHIARLLAVAIDLPRVHRGGEIACHVEEHRYLATDDHGCRCLFATLASANAASVGARYPQDGATDPVPFEAPRSYRLDSVAAIVTAIKAVDCYRYQSCECEGWTGSPAEVWTARLRDTLVRTLPGFERAYSDAPWSIGHQSEGVAALA